MEIEILFPQFQKEGYRILKKSLELYMEYQKSYCYKLIYDSFHNNQIETNTFTQQNQDIKIAILNLTEDLKNIQAYGAETIVNFLINIINDYHQFCLKLNNEISKKKEPDLKIQTICCNCQEHTEKVFIHKMKEQFALTQGLVKTKKKTQAFSRQYLIERTQFMNKLDDILSSQERKKIIELNEIAKTYLYLVEAMKNVKVSQLNADEFRVENFSQSMENEDGFIEKYKTKVTQVIFKLFKQQSIRKSQKQNRENKNDTMNPFNTKKISKLRNQKEVQTNPMDDMERIKFLEKDYAKILNEMELLKKSKAKTQAEAIAHIKKVNQANMKVAEMKQQVFRQEERNRLCEEKIQYLEINLQEEKKWKESEKDIFLQPYKVEIVERKNKESKLQLQIKKLKHTLSLREVRKKMSLKKEEKVEDKVSDEDIETDKLDESVYIKKNKSKKNKKKGERNSKGLKQLMIFQTVDMIVNNSEKKNLKLRKSVKLLRSISKKKSIESKKNIEKPINLTVDQKLFEINNQEKKLQQPEIVPPEEEKPQKQYKPIKTQVEEEKSLRKTRTLQKFQTSKVSISKLLHTKPKIVVQKEKELPKLADIRQDHLYLFGGQKTANEYQKGIGIWPYLETADKLVIDFENTFLSAEIQKYFGYLELRNNEKYIEYSEFLKEPIKYFDKKRKGNEIKNNHIDSKYIKVTFQKLIRFHKICHHGCNHVMTFLNQIGFQQN